ncbi:MAG TPA: flavodoxin-dependent (E)-4-hydroxy-3-methylbut-2-enyl-diphosphate synthase, partial [Chitinophagaceae bacterium]|nr:flavodoxin-dependent (E)-4-hydroxy-3-methylbut-2-enyl-diphosphate synthase [Chitinophagaceae bacterium]
LLAKTMQDEFGECYPLHLGVTEAGDGEDGRIKSAIGIGSLMEDGLGDTIRVSLTEDPELEIPVCRDIVKRYTQTKDQTEITAPEHKIEAKLPYDPFNYQRRKTFAIGNIGGKQVPVVIADLHKIEKITAPHLRSIGYSYDEATDKWNIGDAAADYIYSAGQLLDFNLPGTLKMIVSVAAWQQSTDKEKYFPIFGLDEFTAYIGQSNKAATMNFVMIDATEAETAAFSDLQRLLAGDPSLAMSVVFCFSSTKKNAMQSVREMFTGMLNRNIDNPVILITDSSMQTPDEHLIHFATETGALLLEGFGDGICLGFTNAAKMSGANTKGRTYLEVKDIYQFTNNTAFSILQATRTRISKTEYISCPSCGRTLFDLQETTAKIRSRTNHLKGVKIAIMGCIVNGPGEMADADFGYVGSGPGKITLYKGKEVVKRNVNSEIAVDELINLLKESDAWIENN